MPKLDANTILDRLRDLYHVDSDSALARRLKLPQSNISMRRKRNSPPYDLCVDAASEFGVSLDWLLLGIKPDATTDSVNPRQQRLQRFTSAWLATRSEDEAAWFEIQLAHAIPDYLPWLSRHQNDKGPHQATP